MRSSACWSSSSAIVSIGQISSRTNARIQSSFSWNSGSVEKSHAMSPSSRSGSRRPLSRLLGMSMPAFVPAADARARTVLGEVPEPEPAADEALVAVEAYSINRGETFLLEHPRDGWRPGQDVAGRVERAAADGSGPRAGARVVAHVTG